MAEWILLARLLRPQGRRGELLAEVLTDFPDRFAHPGPVHLLPPEAAENASRTNQPDKNHPQKVQPQKNQPRLAQIEAHWFPVGRNAGRVVLQFAGVDSISAAESLAGWSVALPQSERMPLSDGAVYVSDLIGCEVFNGAARVGVVEGLEFPAPAPVEKDSADAPALLRVMEGSTEHLIPFAKAWLVSVDTTAKRIVMRLPEGLLDINHGGTPE